MRRIVVLICAGASLLAAATPGFDAARYLDHIKFLSSDELKGRATGSPELETAAAYITKQFRQLGLKPVAGASYLQPFEVTTAANLGKQNLFDATTGDATVSLQVSKDFIPLSFSASGTFEGSVVFAGYGITAKEYNYDDYAGIDAKGKFVVVLAHEPQEFDEKSVFAGKAYTYHSEAYSKASNARAHGAKGVILVADRANHLADPETLEKFGRTDGPAEAPIPMVQVLEESAAKLLGGRNLRDLGKKIDAGLQPQSFELPGVRLREQIGIERVLKTVHNVLGYLPGETDEYLIIGAHYDHLGLGEHFSMAPSLAGTVHHGADDNASGTAGVLELARYFAAQPKLKRGILFMTFAGEELGLLGSGYYANHPLMPLAKAATMVNLDMIGRVREGKLYVGGAGTGTGLQADLDSAAAKYRFKIDFSDNGYGSSDHTSFTTKQVPVLFFFSGLHGDYHKPSDTWDKIDAAGAVEVLGMVADVATRIDSAAELPKFVRVEPKVSAHSGDAPAPSGSSGGGYGPNFGSIPDFAEPPKGVRFADVKEGSPAALAGLKPGDIMITFGDRDIANLYDFTYALRSHKAGDEVLVEVLRNDKKLAVKVKLTERK